MKTNTLRVLNKNAHEINPDMIGLFFEDINCAADGGLYAEMLENRSFEAVLSRGNGRDYYLKEDGLYAWSATCENSDMTISMNMALSYQNPHYLRFTALKAGAGFANKAYDGLCLKKGMKYKISWWAREVKYFSGDFEVMLTKDGAKYGSSLVKFERAYTEEPDGYKAMIGDIIPKTWKKYETEIVATDDVKGAKFELHLTEEGIVEFDLISMIPDDAVEGVFRKDLLEALQNLHPGFLRFPGGCIVEGSSLMFRYQWKNTVGELKDRKINTNLWAVAGGNTLWADEIQDAHYMQSYGIGFYEYFRLCELLSSEIRTCKAVPVLNVGVACQFRTYEKVDVESEEFDKYVQDALDLIEFANGDVNTKWGALRAKMGHPESFNLEMIAIGNEQWESPIVDMAPRYVAFEKAIHEKYPEIKCLGTAGPFVKEALYDKAWNFYREGCAENKNFTYAVDEHYYVAPQWLYDNVSFYDEYPRDVHVFAGEYAAHDANQSNSVEAGVAEAAMITGMERNGDVVKLASYAPLFNRIGHSHWTPDMIWFTEDEVIYTPSYATQKIFSDYAGDYAVELDGQEKELRKNEIYVSVVRKGDATIVKLVNAAAKEQEVALQDEAGNAIVKNAELARMMAANGEAKVPVKTDACYHDHNHAVPIEIMDNVTMCKMRAPEECSLAVTEVKLEGKVLLPAKSVTAIKF